MRLSDQQHEFVKDVHKLFTYLLEHHIKFTLGESWRPAFVQYIYWYFGRSLIKENGEHGNRLAIDIIFYGTKKYVPLENTVESVKKLNYIGDFWENLSEFNRWGGRWNIKGKPDIYHFERVKQ